MIFSIAKPIGILGVWFSYSLAAASKYARHDAAPRINGIDTNNVTVFDYPSSTHLNIGQNLLEAAMEDFAYIFYTERKVKTAFEKYVASNYVQHNPDILDGRDSAITALQPLFASTAQGFEVARVMVGNEYTTIHIKATNEGGPSYSVFDVYRTKGSCIVEHWDCMQEMVNNTVSLHPYF